MSNRGRTTCSAVEIGRVVYVFHDDDHDQDDVGFFSYSLLCKVRIRAVTVEIMKTSALIVVLTFFPNYFMWLADGGKLRDFLNCSVNLTFIQDITCR